MTSYNFDNFDPEKYLQQYVWDADVLELGKQNMKWIHDMFKQYNIRGNTLLDIGTGPAVQTLLPAVKHVKQITVSDYAESNLHYLRDVKKGTNSISEYYLNYMNILDNKKMAVKDRNTQFVCTLRDICFLDLRKDDPLGSKNNFDILTSFYCLEIISDKKTDWFRNFKNLATLQNPGGYLFIIGDLNGSEMIVENEVHTFAYITHGDIWDLMRQNNYTIIDFSSVESLDRFNAGSNMDKRTYRLVARMDA